MLSNVILADHENVVKKLLEKDAHSNGTNSGGSTLLNSGNVQNFEGQPSVASLRDTAKKLKANSKH